jgi:septum formation protein
MAIPFVYLASKSPRRRELLAQVGVAHEIFARDAAAEASEVDETPTPGEAPAEYVQRVARAKAAAGWDRVCKERLPLHPLLAADTTVAVDGHILGKPSSAGAAEDMLRALSGRTHQVYTAVAVAWNNRIEMALSESDVTMRVLSEAEIARYASAMEPIDKAGAYAVQGRAAIFIERIEGSYSGVMGLPLFETANLLSGAGLVLL